nr:hypothetical protein BHI3_15530 [Bacteriovorax sp. HI3]
MLLKLSFILLTSGLLHAQSVNPFVSPFAEKIDLSDENFKKAYDETSKKLMAFIESKDPKKDGELLKSFKNSTSCMFSFFRASDFNSHTEIWDSLLQNAMLHPNYEEKIQQIESQKDKDDQKKIVSPAELRKFCTFQINQEALKKMENDWKLKDTQVSEDYSALMVYLPKAHKELRANFQTMKDFIDGMRLMLKDKTILDKDSILYKEIIFQLFSQMIYQSEVTVPMSLERMSKECQPFIDTIYNKKCKDVALYKDIPGKNTRLAYCLDDHQKDFPVTCGYKKIIRPYSDILKR